MRAAERPLLCQHRRQLLQLHFVPAVKAFRFHTYHIVRVFGNHGNHVQIHRAGHYHAVVVVGVVASDLGAAGRGIDGGFPFPAV